MTPEELLSKLKTKEIEEYHDEKTGETIRYFNKSYQHLCRTCSGRRWKDIDKAYAEELVTTILSSN